MGTGENTGENVGLNTGTDGNANQTIQWINFSLPTVQVGSGWTIDLNNYITGSDSATFTVIAGALPSGLTLNANGTFSGVTDTASSGSVTFAANSAPSSAEAWSVTSASGYYFYDGWETADMSATNAEGFSWAANNRTSIVTMNSGAGPSSAWCLPDPVEQTTVVWNNGQTCNTTPDEDWTPYAGNYALRFRYPEGLEQAEQRYNLGSALTDVWFRYWFRVPLNFSYPLTNPNNNKFFAVWMDGYETQGNGSTCWWSLWRQGSDPIARMGTTYNPGNGNLTFGYGNYFNNFMTPADAGRWMQIVLRCKAETSPGAGNGQMQAYRRWEGVGNWTTMQDVGGLAIKLPNDNNPPGFRNGYIMGWANGTYAEETNYLIDEFTVSDSSLL